MSWERKESNKSFEAHVQPQFPLLYVLHWTANICMTILVKATIGCQEMIEYLLLSTLTIRRNINVFTIVTAFLERGREVLQAHKPRFN